MYFPGDPLFALDPIYQSIIDPAARERLVADYDHDVSEPEWALGYRWDMVLTGPEVDLDGTGGRRPCLSAPRRRPGRTLQTPSQTVGPFFGYALPYAGGARGCAPRGSPTPSACTARSSTVRATRPRRDRRDLARGCRGPRDPRSAAASTATATR